MFMKVQVMIIVLCGCSCTALLTRVRVVWGTGNSYSLEEVNKKKEMERFTSFTKPHHAYCACYTTLYLLSILMFMFHQSIHLTVQFIEKIWKVVSSILHVLCVYTLTRFKRYFYILSIDNADPLYFLYLVLNGELKLKHR